MAWPKGDVEFRGYDPALALKPKGAARKRNLVVVVGFGAAQPVVPAPAQTAEPRNRRVQVVNLGA
jgi:flagellar motor protein MotB